MGTRSWDRFDGTWRLALGGTFPGVDELGPMKLDPGPDQPGLARLEAAGEELTVRDVNDGPVLTMPGVDVGGRRGLPPDIRRLGEHVGPAGTRGVELGTHDGSRTRRQAGLQRPDGVWPPLSSQRQASSSVCTMISRSAAASTVSATEQFARGGIASAR